MKFNLTLKSQPVIIICLVIWSQMKCEDEDVHGLWEFDCFKDSQIFWGKV